MAPDFERLARTPWPIACWTSSGIRLLSSALACSCSRCADLVREKIPANSAQAFEEFTVPLCRGHHRELHRCGDEAEWWKKAGIDPTVCARTLWLASHPYPVAAMVEGASA